MSTSLCQKIIVDAELYQFKKNKYSQVCLGSAVVRVMDSHSCVRGSNPSQGNHIYVML